MNRADLIAKHQPEQFAVKVLLVVAEAVAKFELLVSLKLLVPPPQQSVFATNIGRNVQLRTGKQGHQFAGRFLVGHRPHHEPRWHPFVQGNVSPLENNPHFLPIHAARLGESMIKVNSFYARFCITVLHGTVYLIFDICTVRAFGHLSRHDSAVAQPAGKHIEEVNAMLHKNTPAFGAIPKPVFRRKPLVARIILEIAVQHLPQ